MPSPTQISGVPLRPDGRRVPRVGPRFRVPFLPDLGNHSGGNCTEGGGLGDVFHNHGDTDA
jgi:hypothetical protein